MLNQCADYAQRGEGKRPAAGLGREAVEKGRVWLCRTATMESEDPRIADEVTMMGRAGVGVGVGVGSAGGLKEVALV